MSCSRCSPSQHGSSPATLTDLDNQLPLGRETTCTSPTFIKESSSQQRAESSSSLSSSSSSSTCSKEEKLKMTCAVKDCEKSALKSRRYQLLPWKCKYHRNRTYKETYKRRKAMANQDMYSIEVKTPSLDCQGDRPGTASKQRLGEQRSMLEQVLNEKKMSLMQSPIVLDFLQKQQQKKHQHQKHQQKQWGLQQAHSYSHPPHH